MVRRFLFGAALGLSGLLAFSSGPAQAQYTCTTTSTDSTCTNSGTAGGENNLVFGTGQNATTINSGTSGSIESSVFFSGGDATTTNSGTVNGDVITTTGNGNATSNNSGTITGMIETSAGGGGNAITNNSGTVSGAMVTSAGGGGNAITNNSGTANIVITLTANIGNAITNNSGTVTGTILTSTNGGGNATVNNSGTAASIISGASGGGNATTINSGNSSSIDTATSGSGNATTVNSGTVNSIETSTIGGGNATTINSGTVTSIVVTNAILAGNALLINSGTIRGGAYLDATAASAVTNYGVISGGSSGLAIQFLGGPDTLTNVIGSRVIGAIDLVGVKDTVNFVGGNWLFTFNTLAAATINANGAPFVVSGNRVAVLDPTAFGMTDRTLMDFTGAVSSMLHSRFDDLAWPASVAPAGSNAFAGTPANTVAEQANAAFAGIPALAYAGQIGASVVPNAIAVGRETATVAWSQGFAGARQQQAEGPMLASTNSLYGGAIGLDTPFGSNLRLGAFVGAGHGRFGAELDTQAVNTDYVFGGGYGRADWTWQFLDFAVSTGHTANASTRTIADNLSPTGLDTATASYGGWYVSPELAYGVRLPLGSAMMLVPIGRLRYLGASLDGYTETGSAANLSVPRRNVSDFEQRFELDLLCINETRFGVLKTTVKAGVLGLERLGDTTVNTVLIGQNLAFATPGPNVTGGGFIGLDLDYRLTKTFRLFATGEATLMTDRGVIGTVEGGVRAAF
jgi:hypothetical protein